MNALTIKPVKQTLFGGYDGPRDQIGNCFPACIASLLGMSLDDVPHWYSTLWNGDTDGTWYAILAWLQERGYSMVAHEWPLHPAWEKSLVGAIVIISGHSPRFGPGTSHAVIGKLLGDGRWELLHDPHPEGTGVTGEPNMVEMVFPYFREIDRTIGCLAANGFVQRCRECGCTDMRACPGGCHWVEPDLCSCCEGKG